MKDNFSVRSDRYAKYRPSYPEALFAHLDTLVPAKLNAWDCGTGNGQVAVELAKRFEKVFATDISAAQIEQAQQADNIGYSVQSAEKTNFDDRQFDLITVAQAIHWFNFDAFYTEVRRTAKQNAILCVIGYGNVLVSDTIDSVVGELYHKVLGTYWDAERRYIDEQYTTIPFPFEELPAPRLTMEQQWTAEHFIGYLNTWSAVKHYTERNAHNPVHAVQDEILRLWGSGARTVSFPLLLRMGRVEL